MTAILAILLLGLPIVIFLGTAIGVCVVGIKVAKAPKIRRPVEYNYSVLPPQVVTSATPVTQAAPTRTTPKHFEYEIGGFPTRQISELEGLLSGSPRRVQVEVAWLDNYAGINYPARKGPFYVAGKFCCTATITGYIRSYNVTTDYAEICLNSHGPEMSVLGATQRLYYKAWNYYQPDVFIKSITILE